MAGIQKDPVLPVPELNYKKQSLPDKIIGIPSYYGKEGIS